MKKKLADTLNCKQCGHDWIPRKLKGAYRQCPGCKSYLWQYSMKAIKSAFPRLSRGNPHQVAEKPRLAFFAGHGCVDRASQYSRKHKGTGFEISADGKKCVAGTDSAIDRFMYKDGGMTDKYIKWLYG